LVTYFDWLGRFGALAIELHFSTARGIGRD
jgi:hypothetical protein